MDYNNQQSQHSNTQYSYDAVPPTYTPIQTANPNNGFAICSLICGIVGILCCCCCGIGCLLGIIGIILAIVSKSKNGGQMSGLAVGGLVCSIIASIFGVAGLIYVLAVGGMDSFMDEFYKGYYGK